MNLSEFDLRQLRELLEQVKQAINELEQKELSRARDEIFAIAKNAGIPLKDLLKPPSRNKNGFIFQAVPRYHHPTDPSIQWSGKGRRPDWIKKFLAEGKTLEDFRSLESE